MNDSISKTSICNDLTIVQQIKDERLSSKQRIVNSKHHFNCHSYFYPGSRKHCPSWVSS